MLSAMPSKERARSPIWSRDFESTRTEKSPAAIARVRHWLQHDPLDEEAYRRLMRLLALGGDRMAALQAYLQCKGALQRELAAEPSAETVRTFERIRGAELGLLSTERREGNLAASSLVGRQAEWARLREAWDWAVNGRA